MDGWMEMTMTIYIEHVTMERWTPCDNWNTHTYAHYSKIIHIHNICWRRINFESIHTHRTCIISRILLSIATGIEVWASSWFDFALFERWSPMIRVLESFFHAAVDRWWVMLIEMNTVATRIMFLNGVVKNTNLMSFVQTSDEDTKKSHQYRYIRLRCIRCMSWVAFLNSNRAKFQLNGSTATNGNCIT